MKRILTGLVLAVMLTGGAAAGLLSPERAISSAQNYTPIPVASACCCKCCSKGKACGNTCISRSNKCHTGGGCACDQPYCEPGC